MISHDDLVQGTPAWRAHRAKFFNASDAPAMMGCSPYKTRTELLDELSGALATEHDSATEARFAEGHRAEALARPLAEKLIGQDLFTTVGSNGTLSASFDGLTLIEGVGFEHKSLNADLRAVMVEGCTGAELPLHYRVQMEQQCMVSGCDRVLFMASKWSGDKLVEERHCWYTPDAELAKRIRAGWLQFSRDLSDHRPAKAAAAPSAATIEALPALTVRIEGKVVSSNLEGFRAAADKFLASISTELSTDQDFANADRTGKFLKDGEDRLDLVKAQAQAEVSSIDELYRTIGHIKEEMRQKRLDLDRKVTRRKDEIRGEKVAAAQLLLDEHTASLNKRLGTSWLGRVFGGFGEAIKGKRTVSSIDDALSVALANAKIEQSALADRLEINRNSLLPGERDWFFLFADFAQVGTKPAEDFKAIAEQRIAKHKADEAKRADDAAAVAMLAPVQHPQATPISATVVDAGLVGADARPNISTGAIGDRLGFKLPGEFIEQVLGVPHAATEKRAVYWREAQWPQIKVALVKHIGGLA